MGLSSLCLRMSNSPCSLSVARLSAFLAGSTGVRSFPMKVWNKYSVVPCYGAHFMVIRSECRFFNGDERYRFAFGFIVADDDEAFAIA